jgi:hypothetical protein
VLLRARSGLYFRVCGKDVYAVRKLLAARIPPLLLPLLLPLALLAGCGQTVSGSPNTDTAKTPTATAYPTATLAPTVAPTPAALTSGHPCTTDTSGQVSYVWIGDLKVSQAHFILAYPARQLPATLNTSKPYRLPANAFDPPDPPVNPHTDDGNGYSLTICNTAKSASHTIYGVTVSIAAFTPYTGTLNTWQFCDSVYARPDGVQGGGCGGAYVTDEKLQAQFAGDAGVGAKAQVIQLGTGTAAPDGGLDTSPLPIRLGPGQMLVVTLGVTPPTALGTYNFAFGLSYDSVTSAPISTMQPTLFDSATVAWNGQNCAKPALLSQIPAAITNPPTDYVCAP